MQTFWRVSRLVAMLGLLGAAAFSPAQAASFLTGSLSDAANFAVLYEGNGNNQLGINNGPGLNGLAVNGNIGIGAPSGSTTSSLQASGPLVINSNVLFAGAVSSNVVSGTQGNITVNGTITGNNANVQTDLNNLNSLSSTLGTATGTALAINTGGSGGSQTVNASSGTAIASGPNAGDLVFAVGSMSFNNNTTLTINGTANQLVVFDMPFSAQFGGVIQLTGGITSDQVLFNIVGGSGLTGGNTDQINNNGQVALQGIFLDPNGAISVVHAIVNGRVFGGDTSNMQIVSGGQVNAPSGGGRQVPEPSSIALLLAALVGLGLYLRRIGFNAFAT